MLPERHLGLAQAGELADLDQRLHRCAAALKHTALTELPGPVNLEEGAA